MKNKLWIPNWTVHHNLRKKLCVSQNCLVIKSTKIICVKFLNLTEELIQSDKVCHLSAYLLT